MGTLVCELRLRADIQLRSDLHRPLQPSMAGKLSSGAFFAALVPGTRLGRRCVLCSVMNATEHG